MRVLVVDDELVLCKQIQNAFQGEGYAVDLAHDGEDAAHLGANEPYDLIILDIGLPKQDGISVLKAWRAEGLDMPVLLLTARDGWSERVDGLDAGADDYLSKPFHMSELLARARALIRRNKGRMQEVFSQGGFSFDLRTGTATVDGLPVKLTAQEVAVLRYLVHNSGRYVTRTEIVDHIYDYNSDPDSNTIAVFIGRLRRKLGPDVITSERGRGYMIVAEK
ncbi:MAG: response regulator transcription factor [Rhodobacteraceae bacterium]|nr:response regulator transcription factor [Paracoccaceae bacterium]